MGRQHIGLYGSITSRQEMDDFSARVLTVTQGTKGLLFAVDSSDRQRIHEARRELLELLKDERLQES